MTAATGAKSISVALDGVATGGTIDLAEETAGNVETVNVSGSVATTAGANALTIGSTGTPANGTALTDLSALNVSLTSNTTVTVSSAAAANIETLDMSGSTGNLSATITAEDYDAEEVAVTFGSGNDSITLDHDDGATAGRAMTITLGDGDDSLTLSQASGNLFAADDQADLEASLITVADFAAADDTIDVSALAARNAQNLVDAQISGLADGATLFDAVESVAGLGNMSVFEFEGSTYIFNDTDAGSDLTAGDTLIELAGVAIGDLGANNFVA